RRLSGAGPKGRTCAADGLVLVAAGLHLSRQCGGRDRLRAGRRLDAEVSALSARGTVRHTLRRRCQSSACAVALEGELSLHRQLSYVRNSRWFRPGAELSAELLRLARAWRVIGECGADEHQDSGASRAGSFPPGDAKSHAAARHLEAGTAADPSSP